MPQTLIREHHHFLSSGHLRLRPATDADFPLLAHLGRDPEVLYYCEGDDVREPYTIENIIGIYKTVTDAFCFIMEYDGNPIGDCWLQRMNLPDLLERYPGLDLRRIDISIGEKEYWGRGIGTAAVKLLTQFGFEKEKTDMIFYLPADYNIRSCRTAERVGYKLLGKTEEITAKSRYRMDYALTREEYYLL